jgi:hypothetical protein
MIGAELSTTGAESAPKSAPIEWPNLTQNWGKQEVEAVLPQLLRFCAPSVFVAHRMHY